MRRMSLIVLAGAIWLLVSCMPRNAQAKQLVNTRIAQTQSCGQFTWLVLANGAADIEMPACTETQIPSGWLCAGDVIADHTPQWDTDSEAGPNNSANSGLILRLRALTMIEAPWGADCAAPQFRNWNQFIGDELSSGCISGCTVVITKDYPQQYAVAVADITFGNGGTYPMPANYTCAGDIYADGVQLFDANQYTGLVTTFVKTQSLVTAPFGADCAYSDERSPEQFVADESTYGCGGNGCGSVLYRTWP